MKPKARTLQERFGFLDAELTTPAHDALMVWLDSTIDTLLGEIVARPEIVSHSSTDVRWQYGNLEVVERLRKRAKEMDWTQLPNPKVLKKVWELPIVTGNGYTVGFADMGVAYVLPEMMFSDGDQYALDWESGKRHCYFEVKPSIPSVGELIRQIRMYETYVDGQWFVVSPDNRCVEILRGQKIGFVQAPGGL